MDCDGERSSPSWAWAHSRRISTVTRLISLVNHHLGNRADRIYSEVNVYPQLIYLEVGWGVRGHQCFICSCLWIFQQQRRCSNARRGLLRGFVWYELSPLHAESSSSRCSWSLFTVFGFFPPSLIQGACLTSSYCLHLFGFYDLLHNFDILRCVSSPAAPLRPPQCRSRLCVT